MNQLRFLILSVAASLLQPGWGLTVTPGVVASIHDEPHDGVGDSFNAPPFEGLLRLQVGNREDRAIQEFDIAALAGSGIVSATVSGRVSVNNSFDVGVRTFDFGLYDANGVAELSDYNLPVTVVGSGSYHPPLDTFFTYSIDVTTELQTLVSGGSTWMGLRVDCTSDPNFPNILEQGPAQLDVTFVLPPACTITAPAPGATVTGEVALSVDGDDPQGGPVDLAFELSTDGGLTWAPATPAPTSPTTNPDPGRATPFAGLGFTWDSRGDGVGIAIVQPTDLRVVITSGPVAGECLLDLVVDNTALCTGVCGDCTQDGVGPNILDALMAAQLGVGLFSPTPAQTGCCDVNADQSISVVDALGIAQAGAGLPVTLTCP